MKEQKLTIISAIFIALVAITLITWRVKSDLKAKLSPGESVWRLSYKVIINKAKAGMRLQMSLPRTSSQSRIFQEKFLRSGLLMDILRSQSTKRREAIAVALTDTEKIYFTAEFDIRLKPQNKPSMYKELLDANLQAKYLTKQKGIQAKSSNIKKILQKWRAQKLDKEKLADQIFQYCSDQIALGGESSSIDAKETLHQKIGNSLGKARAMVALCRAGKIPSRIAVGYVLEKTRKAKIHTWVEVYLENHWISYDPNYGYARQLPASYILVGYDYDKVIQVTGAKEWDYQISIEKLPVSPTSALSQTNSLLAVADLTRMPSEMQNAIAVLLLLPLGTLITVIFRSIIGLSTFGTFAPCLIALSFVYADWRTGLAIFLIVMFVGLSSRGLLNRLKLLILPRLGIILTLVVLCMVMGVSLLDYLELTPSARTVVLPIIILTMLVERFYISVEEDGIRSSLKMLAGTILVAFCCYSLLSWQELGLLAVTYPEAQLFIISALLILGRYTGYRLTELIRFRDIIAAKKEKP